MTAGYPDYQDYAQWHGAPLESATVNVPAAGIVLGPYAVHNWASVKILLNQVSGGIELILSYYSDQALTEFVSGYSLYATNNSNLNVTVPNDGPWLSIVAGTPSGLAQTGYLSIAPSNVATPRLAYSGSGGTLTTGGQSLAASGTATWPVPVVSPGLAPVFWGPEDATGKLQIELIPQPNQPNSPADLWRSSAATAEGEHLVNLPDFPCEFKVTNTDATAAHSYRLTCIPPV